MDNYFVLHARKIHTTVGCIEVLTHNLRKKPNLEEFIDVNKSIYNYYHGATNENFLEKFKEFISNLPRKIQKNASRIIEFVVTFSHEYGEGWEENLELKNKIEKYFNDAEKFLRQRYGDVIICRADHYDELTPHSHIMLVPLCKNKNGILRFSSSEFLGGIKGLTELHNKFHTEVGIIYGLDRGEKDSRTKHSDLKNYKEWENEQKRLIEEKRRVLDQQLAETQRQQELNAKNEILLNKEKKKRFEQRGKLLKDKAHVANREKDLELIDEKILEQTPQIPLPPVQFTEKSPKTWAEEVQKLINEPFAKICKAYYFLKNKYDILFQKLTKITKLNHQYKSRAEKAEKDLVEKPINEIIAMREERKKIEQEQKKTNQKKVSSL